MVGVVVTALIHGAAAFALLSAVSASQRLQTEQQGKFIVSGDFYEWVHGNDGADWSGPLDESVNSAFREEAARMVDRSGGDA